MNKKMARLQQRTFDFENPPADEPRRVALSTSLPPPSKDATPPPLIRPDRQIVFPDASTHYDWPAASLLHDRNTITVDRITADIDGPAHRFVIRRGDTVEAYVANNKFHVGEVIGISHERNEVQVAWDDTLEKGGWFHVGRIYPAVEPEEKRPSNSEPRSEIIAKEIATSENGSTETHLAPISPPPYTFDEFKTFYREFSDGNIPFDDYKQNFERLLENRDEVKKELLSRFKAKEMAVLASRFGSWTANRSTKEENASSIVKNMLSSFVLDGSVSYQPFSGETYEQALTKKVRAVTFGEYARAFEKRQEESMAQEKALTNPETLAEFQTFIRKKGEDALTDEQLSNFDTLHADISRERRANQAETTVTKFQSEDLQGITFKVIEGYHDKRQCPLWIVQLETRVERDAFNELNRKAKMLGGWYSSFKKATAGFQFLSKDNADKFSSLLEGDADRKDVLAARKARKELSASERLHELATELSTRADEEITRSNESLQNTARRADIQAGIRGRGYAGLALSRSMHSIAEALSRNDAKYLDGIRHKTQIETLDTVLYLAKWKNVRTVKKLDNESHYSHAIRQESIESEPISLNTIRFTEYPYPHFYKRTLLELIKAGQNKSGVKQAAHKIEKRLSREKDDYVTFKAEHDIEAVTDFIQRCKGTGIDVDHANRSLEHYKRLQRAGISDIHELRTALREYLTHRSAARGDDPVKVAERELIGKKLPGFFPTPRPVIREMLELARIEDHHQVLEPSCGKGDILDAIQEEHPDIALHAIEQNRSLADVLAAKGHNVEFADFLEHAGVYDRIVMNPPFENGQDIDHVRHAYSRLLPGGRLVSVMCEGPFFRSDKKSVEFRNWLDELGAKTEQLPEDAFSGREAFRETGVRTRLVTIKK